MPITVKCECGGKFRVGDQHAGKKIKCPKCSNAVQVPDEAEEAAAEPAGARKSTDAKKKGGTSKITREPERGGRAKVDYSQGDTVNLDTSKIEVLSNRSITSKKDKKEKGTGVISSPASHENDRKKVVVLSVVVGVLLVGSIGVGYKVLHESAAGQNPAPTPAQPPSKPAGGQPNPTPTNPNPVPNPPPVNPTPPGPVPTMPSEPESLDGLDWPVTELGLDLPAAVRKGTTVTAKGSMTEEKSGRTRNYDVEFRWEDGVVVQVNGWFEDRVGNRLRFGSLTFLGPKDEALAAAAERGQYLRPGGVKSGTLVIEYANKKGTLEVAFQSCRVASVKGVAVTYDNQYKDVEQLRREQQAVSTLGGTLHEVSEEVSDFALYTAKAK